MRTKDFTSRRRRAVARAARGDGGGGGIGGVGSGGGHGENVIEWRWRPAAERAQRREHRAQRPRSTIVGIRRMQREKGE